MAENISAIISQLQVLQVLLKNGANANEFGPLLIMVEALATNLTRKPSSATLLPTNTESPVDQSLRANKS